MSYLFIGCTNTKIIPSQTTPSMSFSVIQGSTTETSTLFRIVYPKALKVKYIVQANDGKLLKTKIVESVSRKFSVFKVEHVRVNGLSLEKEYTLKITSDKKGWSDERTFRALDTKKKNMSILVASCMSDGYNSVGEVMWPKAFSHNPDVAFLTGDNIYADIFSGLYLGSFAKVNPMHLWNRYVDHAMSLKVNFMRELTPIYVTWDDHDFGKNNGGREFPYVKQSKQLLNTFFARGNLGDLNYGPGVSSLVSLGGMNFFFLDGRSFRDSKKNASGRHFGRKQREWLRTNINSKKLNWLISGDQFFGGYHPFESFEGDHPEAFETFIKELKSSKSQIAFISGDRHLVEVMKVPESKLGYTTYEYTISGIQTKMFPRSLDRNPNPMRVGGFDGRANYAIIKTQNLGGNVKTEFYGYSKSGIETKVTHSHQIN